MRTDASRSDAGRGRAELAVFLLLAVLVWPVLTVGFVGGYGLVVWMQQQIYGPPQYGNAPHANPPAGNPPTGNQPSGNPPSGGAPHAK